MNKKLETILKETVIIISALSPQLFHSNLYAQGTIGPTTVISPKGAHQPTQNMMSNQPIPSGPNQGQTPVYQGQSQIGHLPDGSIVMRAQPYGYPQNTFPETEQPTQQSYSPKPPNNQSRPQYNLPTAESYIKKGDDAWKKDDYQSLIYVSEEGLDKIKQKKIIATEEEIRKIEHRKSAGYDMLNRR